jgi:hypothetical protein
VPQDQEWLFKLFESLSRDPKMRLNMKMFDESTLQGKIIFLLKIRRSIGHSAVKTSWKSAELRILKIIINDPIFLNVQRRLYLQEWIQKEYRF